MTIKEYYQNYKKYGRGQFIKDIWDGEDKTFDGFYDNCISKMMLPPKSVLTWHEMFMRYAELPDAIYWIRYYESGSKKSGLWNNRRACKTVFADGFSYVFVSNYEAHEIYNMIASGVVPDEYEFLNLMKSYAFPFHYDAGKRSVSCEETHINCFPVIGTTRGGVLTYKKWYLAHINDIKSEYLRPDGKYKAVDIKSDEGKRIYPRGDMADWQHDAATGRFVRKLQYSLSDEDKELVKAHFLRFVDPLNYFVVPSIGNEINAVYGALKKSVGEYKKLTAYMAEKYESAYCKSYTDGFKKKALIALQTVSADGTEVINIDYGPVSRKSKDAKTVTTGVAATPVKRSALKISGTGVGQYAKKKFTDLLESGKLTEAQLDDLKDKGYCSKNFGISYPVIADDIAGTFVPRRYYKNYLVAGKYRICCEWLERHRAKIDQWFKSHGFITN